MYFRWILMLLLTVVGGSLYLFYSRAEAAETARAVAQTAVTPALQISKVSEPTIVTAGQPITYTIRITNSTNRPLQNIVIHDPLPLGVETNGLSTIDVINGSSPAIQVSPPRITGTVGVLNQGGMIFLTIHAAVRRNATGLTLTNGVTVTALTADQTPYRNYTAVQTGLITLTPTPTPSHTPTPTVTTTLPATPLPTTTATATATNTPLATPSPTPSPTGTATPTLVPNLADLQIGKSALPTLFVAGELLTYTLVITNYGPGMAHDLLIQDSLPPGLHLEGPSRMSIAGGETPKLVLSRTIVTGTAVLLQSGGSIRITARTRVEANFVGDDLVNEATVTSITPDQDSTNNRVSLLTERVGKKVEQESRLYLPLVQRE